MANDQLMGINYTGGNQWDSSTTNTSGKTTSGKIFSDQAANKLLYDLLSADGGISSILSGQGLVGGSDSSSTTLMSQDFMTKVYGELANVMAQNVSTTEGLQKTNASSKTKKTSIGLDPSKAIGKLFGIG